MQPGQTALIVCMAVGGIVVSAAIATHVWECILVSRKKKAKQIQDEEKARIALTSPTFASPIYSNFAAKPNTALAGGIPGGSIQAMKHVFKVSGPPENNGFQPLLSPTSPTLTIRTPLSPSAVYSPLTPTSPSAFTDHRPLLSSAALPATLPLFHGRSSHDNLTHLPPPRIPRSRLNGFATPPRTSSNRGGSSINKDSQAPLSTSQPNHIFARSVSELVGSVAPSRAVRAGSMNRKGELRETEENMQEVGKLGW